MLFCIILDFHRIIPIFNTGGLTVFSLPLSGSTSQPVVKRRLLFSSAVDDAAPAWDFPRMTIFRLLSMLGLLLACIPAAQAADVVRAPHAEVRLIAATADHRPGEAVEIGVAFRLDPGWYIYAENPGDAGLPTTVAWNLPTGASVGPLVYPPHRTFDEAGLTTYGYLGRPVFTARAVPPPEDASLPIRARVSWLVCKEICIPGDADLDLTLPVATGAPTPSADAELFATAALPPPPAPTLGLWLALGLAFAGGVLLNLMPCVLPILALKVLAVARAGRGAARRDATLFGAGAISAFVALGAALALLGAGGQALGWGFQLQSPAMVLVLALVMLLVGLDLSGLLPIGGLPAGFAARLPGNRTPFLTGLLAVVVASPCTAPLMGAAVGFAATQPPEIGFLVIIAIGLGFALPMVLVGWVPAFGRLLPRPGPWMLTLRKVLAWPMFGAAAWLAWVLSRQTDGTGLALAALLPAALALAVLWPRARRFAVPVVTLATLAAAVAVETRPARAIAAEDAWSEARVAELRAEGRPVFVDFTAAWCLTCQVNKRATLADAEVIRAFNAKGVVRLVADWTQRDERIGAALARLGRNGVPVYALYVPGRDAPVLLPELLTPGAVRDALSALPAR